MQVDKPSLTIISEPIKYSSGPHSSPIIKSNINTISSPSVSGMNGDVSSLSVDPSFSPNYLQSQKAGTSISVKEPDNIITFQSPAEKFKEEEVNSVSIENRLDDERVRRDHSIMSASTSAAALNTKDRRASLDSEASSTVLNGKQGDFDEIVDGGDDDDDLKKICKFPGANSQESSHWLNTKVSQYTTLAERINFMNTPIPSGKIMRCRIFRSSGGMFSKSYTFSLRSEHGEEWLTAKASNSIASASNYHILLSESLFGGCSAGDMMFDGRKKKVDPRYVGKLKGNYIGSEYLIYSPGVNPSSSEAKTGAKLREELGAVRYSTAQSITNKKLRGPRQICVYLPSIKGDPSQDNGQKCVTEVIRPLDEKNGIMNMVRDLGMDQRSAIPELHSEASQRLMPFINRRPKWSDKLCAFVLNFSQRVTLSSVKNFQLVSAVDHTLSNTDPWFSHDRVILQFGRCKKNDFALDFAWPMTPLQAFGIALAQSESKICCE